MHLNADSQVSGPLPDSTTTNPFDEKNDLPQQTQVGLITL
jgi:hypothetical protein